MISHLKYAALVCEALLYGIAGAAIFAWVGIPAGLISGSMLAVGFAALAGRPVPWPRPLGWVTFIALGVALGATVTPEQLRGVVTYPLSIVFLLVGSFAIVAATTSYLRVVHRWDGLSALIASSPGALSQSLAMAVDMKANAQGVIIVQTFRAITLAAALAPALAAFDLLPPLKGSGAPPEAAPLPLLLTVVVATLTGVAFYRMRFPGGLLFGGMIGSAALHGVGWVEGGLPLPIRDAAMVFVGTMIGGRLASVSPRVFFRYLAAAMGAFCVGVAVAGLFVAASVVLLRGPVAATIFAYAPGAVDTMMVLALAMNLNPVFVGAHHVARVMAVSVGMPILVRAFYGRTPPESDIKRGEPVD